MFGIIDALIAAVINNIVSNLGVAIAITIAILSPIYINFLDKWRRKNALKSALAYEIVKNFQECKEKQTFVIEKLQLLDYGNRVVPTIFGYLHYSAYEAFAISGFLSEMDEKDRDVIEKIYDEFHSLSHFLDADRDIMFFSQGTTLVQNKSIIFNEIINAVKRVESQKVVFDIHFKKGL